MKTAFSAKIIFESENLHEDDIRVPGSLKDPVFSMRKFEEVINNGKVEMNCILAYYTKDTEPVLVIKEK